MGWVKGSAAWPIASEIKSRTTGFFSSRRRHTRYWRDWSLDVCSSDLKADLCRRYPNSARLGRHSTPVEVILRMLVVKRLYNFSYEQTEHFVSDSIVLRQFCRLYLEPVPDDTTLIRWANTIGPETVASLNDQAVELARSLKVTRGRKLRVDSTVVETNVHRPTDSRLLGDGVRVVSRLC